jgi:hypothetical protein
MSSLEKPEFCWPSRLGSSAFCVAGRAVQVSFDSAKRSGVVQEQESHLVASLHPAKPSGQKMAALWALRRWALDRSVGSAAAIDGSASVNGKAKQAAISTDWGGKRLPAAGKLNYSRQ